MAALNTRDTDNILDARIVVDMAERAFELDKNVARLINITNKLKQVESATQPEYHWREFSPLSRESSIDESGFDGSETDVTVPDSSLFLVDDLVYVPSTGEMMLVTAITDATTIAVTRGWGATSGTAANQGDALIILGQAKMEGSDVPTARSAEETDVFNYTEIIRNSVDLTGTLDATKLYGGDERTLQRSRVLRDTKKDMERRVIFGVREKVTSGAHPRRTSRGFIEFLASNSAASKPTWSVVNYGNFVSLAQEVMRYPDADRKEKLFLAGPTLMAAIQRAWEGQIQLSTEDTEYGIKIRRVTAEFGDFLLDTHWLLTGDYAKHGLVVDPSLIKRRPLQGRDLKLYVDVHQRGYDGKKDEYMVESGFQLMNPAAHGHVTYSGE